MRGSIRRELGPAVAMHHPAAPDQINELSVMAAITITRCRELLGDEAIEWSDEDVDTIRRHAQVMAETLVDVFLDTERPR